MTKHLTLAEAIGALGARLDRTPHPALATIGTTSDCIADLRAIICACPELTGPPETTWDNLACETALCIWESMLDRRTQRDGQPWAAPMMTAWDGNGSYGMRCVARYLALELDEIWAGIPDDTRDGITFDWEFVPHMLQFVAWSDIGGDQQGHFLPGAASEALAFCEREQARFAAVAKELADFDATFTAWQAKAKRAAGRLWGYPELIDDEPLNARQACSAGTDPETYAREQGESVDLNEPDPMTLADLAKLYAEPAPKVEG